MVFINLGWFTYESNDWAGGGEESERASKQIQLEIYL